MYDFLMWFPYPVRVVVIFAMLLAWVPLAGLLCFGNWRQALAYTRQWFAVVLGMVAAAVILFVLFSALISPP